MAIDPENTGPLFVKGRSPLYRETPQVPPPASRFEGKGRLLGRIFTDPPDLPFPEVWTLEVRPSSVLIGSSREESRTLHFTQGERSFSVDDLPLGGYEVRVDLGDLDCPKRQVLLALPDSAEIALRLVAHPAGTIEGWIYDAFGVPAAAVPVVLEAAAGGARRSAATEANGRYRFDGVRGGNYKLFVGDPQGPLVPARELVFVRPRLTVPEIELPPLGELALSIVDEHDAPVQGARVSGRGENGGAVSALSDPSGRATARFLPAGQYTLYAEHPDRGHAKVHVAVEAGAPAELRIQLRP